MVTRADREVVAGSGSGGFFILFHFFKIYYVHVSLTRPRRANGAPPPEVGTGAAPGWDNPHVAIGTVSRHRLDRLHTIASNNSKNQTKNFGLSLARSGGRPNILHTNSGFDSTSKGQCRAMVRQL